jgi:RecB family endonuclease NucS
MAKITRILNSSEIKYKILTGLKKLGSQCPGLDQDVTIIDKDGESFRKTTHRQIAGRIDSMSDVYRKHSPKEGDTVSVDVNEHGVLRLSFESKVDGNGKENGVQNEAEFVLEKYLQEFIVSNFEAIFKKKLVLEGEQYVTDVGDIDILAKDPQANAFVVIELKKGREADKVVGQVLRYMGWVAENLCQPNQEVYGIIICKESDERLSYALKMVKNVTVKYYRVDFTLQDQP